MTDPFIFWDPQQFQLFGMLLLLVGGGVLTVGAVETALPGSMGPSARALMLASLVLASYVTWTRTPVFGEAFVVVSTGIAVAVPLAICIDVCKEFARSELG